MGFRQPFTFTLPTNLVYMGPDNVGTALEVHANTGMDLEATNDTDVLLTSDHLLRLACPNSLAANPIPEPYPIATPGSTWRAKPSTANLSRDSNPPDALPSGIPSAFKLTGKATQTGYTDWLMVSGAVPVPAAWNGQPVFFAWYVLANPALAAVVNGGTTPLRVYQFACTSPTDFPYPLNCQYFGYGVNVGDSLLPVNTFRRDGWNWVPAWDVATYPYWAYGIQFAAAWPSGGELEICGQQLAMSTTIPPYVGSGDGSIELIAKDLSLIGIDSLALSGAKIDGLPTQSTVGAAGGASALPIAPTAYIQINGLVVPAYLAS